MARNHIVINSQFQPFSYLELLHPVLMATQAHQQLETEFGELSSMANEVGAYADLQSDPEVYERYKGYADALEERASQLAKSGLNPSSRKAMIGMRDRFASDIIPIQKAYMRREELEKEQRQAMLNNPTMMFSQKASAMKLSDLINNPTLSYDPLSGAQLTQQVAHAASALAKTYMDDKAQLHSLLGSQYYDYVKQQGFSKEAVMEAIMNSENASPILQLIVEDVVGSSGVHGWNDKESLDKAYYYARQGLWSAIGEEKSQILNNKEYLDPLQRAQMAKVTQPDVPEGPDYLNAIGTSHGIESNSEAQKIQDIIDKINYEAEPVKEGSWEEEAAEKTLAGSNWYLDVVEKDIKSNEEKLQKLKAEGKSDKSIKKVEDRLNKLNEHRDEIIKGQITDIEPMRYQKEINEYLKKYNIDPSLSKDQIIAELEKKKKAAVIDYAQFDVKGTDYDNFSQHVLNRAITVSAEGDSEKLKSVQDKKNNNVKVGDFTTSIGTGVIGVSYNRNADNPMINVTTADGGYYKVHHSLLPNFKSYMDTSRELHNIRYNDIINKKNAGYFTEEQANRALINLGDFHFNEYSSVVEYILRGYNQALSKTNAK